MQQVVSVFGFVDSMSAQSATVSPRPRISGRGFLCSHWLLAFFFVFLNLSFLFEKNNNCFWYRDLSVDLLNCA